MEGYIYPYYLKHRNLVLLNLEESRQEDNVDAIHDLRTSFKRIRVIVRFADILSDGSIDSGYITKQFKKLYKTSGKLRDVHVHQQLLCEYQSILGTDFSKYQKFLRKQEARAKKRYRVVSFDYNPFFLINLDEIIKSRLSYITEDSVFLTADQLTENYVKSIHNLYHDFDDIIRFHSIRRHIKNIGYLNNMLNGSLPVEDKLNIDKERLTELGTILGEWHDKVNAFMFFEKYYKKSGDDKNIGLLVEKLMEEKHHEEKRIEQICEDELKL